MTANTHLAAASNRLLSAAVVRSVMEPGSCNRAASTAVSVLAELGMARGAGTMRTLMWRCYRWLARHHRNDLIYRNAVVGQMAPPSSGRIMQEAMINRSIVDYLVVSDSVHAIEIKSDLDGVSRLPAQLRDYRLAAPLVSLLGTQATVERFAEQQEFLTVGLSWLGDDGSVRTLRNPAYAPDLLDSVTMMRSLRQHEYLAIVEALNGPVPTLPNTKLFRYARDITQSIDPVEYHRHFVGMLNSRKPRLSQSVLSRVPAPVKPTVMKINPSRCEVDRLQCWLSRKVIDVPA